MGSTLNSIFPALKNIAADAFQKGLKWADEGFHLEKVSEAEWALRITLCENCPDKKFEETERRCLVCTCKMDFKTSLKYQPFQLGENKELIKCPNGHW